MGHSYGYNRAENIEDYDSAATLIRMLIRCAANGGNYLLWLGVEIDPSFNRKPKACAAE